MNISKEHLSSLIEVGLSIKEISIFLNVSISTIKRHLVKFNIKTIYREKKKKESQVHIVCLECNAEFITQKNNRKFCSNDCSIKNNLNILKINRIEINKRISNSLIKNEQFGHCKQCNLKFKKRSKKSKYCSQSCSSKEISSREDIKEIKRIASSKSAYKRHKEGDISIGWKLRSNLQPSYPEKITMIYLDSLNIEYERELKVGKYFIDFSFKNKIALEIDGRTHEDDEVKIKDEKKDIFLIENGWDVYRIKWINDKKHYLRINEFLFKYKIIEKSGKL